MTNNKNNKRELTLFLKERRLDAESAPILYDEIMRNIQGVKKLTVDMTAVVYISSAGLRALLAALHAMGDDDGSVTLLNVCDNVMHTLQITGFSEIFTIKLKNK